MVTAYRMNEWHSIRFIFFHRFKSGIVPFLITMLVTITLDLTQAIIIGIGVSAIIFLRQVSDLSVLVQEVDWERMRWRGMNVQGNCPHIKRAYLSGPLFFAAMGHFKEAVSNLSNTQVLILSMRAVPMIDLSGTEALNQLQEQFEREGKTLIFCSLQPRVQKWLERSDLKLENKVFTTTDRAVLVAEKMHYCKICYPVA